MTNLPRAEAVGSHFVLYDAAVGGEVVGLLVESGAEDNPTWRFTVRGIAGRVTELSIGPDGVSTPDRWLVLRPADHPVDRLAIEMLRMGPYPTGTEPVAARILGTSFFPGGSGLWREPVERDLPPFPVGGVMIVGQDFHARRQYDASLARGRENLDAPTWRTLRGMLEEIGLSERACFFTNAFVGLRSGDTSVGDYPGARDSAFVQRCRAFLGRQLAEQRPRVVLTLGLPAARMLAALAPRTLAAWAGAMSFASIDTSASGLVSDAHFEIEAGVPPVRASAVALTHPSYRRLNVARRVFVESNGTRHAGAEAERRMLERAIRSLS